MLRGFRWQLLALIVAGGLFVVSLVVRSTESGNTAQPTPVMTATEVVVVAAETPVSTVPAVVPTVGVPVAPQTPEDEVITFREALVGNVQRLNPLLADLNPVDSDITSLIFEGLTQIDEYGEPVPALAKEWVISADGLEYVFTLRDDVLWQDGMPFSAADVSYTMSLLRSPDFSGAEEVGQFWRTVETERLNDFQVRFRLTQPLGSFLSALRIGILPEHALRGTTAAQLASHPFNLSPIGTGPYQLEALRSDRGNRIAIVDLRAAPVYRQRSEGQSGYALDRMRFQLFTTFDEALVALQNGEVDALAGHGRNDRIPLLNTNLNVYTTVEPTLGVLIFNWAKEDTNFFREQRVRMGLETGLDRASIIERHLSNLAVKADSPLVLGSWAYSTDVAWPGHDMAAALNLLQSARIRQTDTETENGEEGEESPPPADAEPPADGVLSFTILTLDDPALVRVAEEIAAQWSQLNVTFTVEALADDVYQERLEAHDFDVVLVELVLGTDPDVYAFWHEGQYPDGKNYGGVADRHISEALERARRDANGINRAVHYADFQRYFVERAIALPLYYPLYTYVTATDIEGVQLGFIGTPSDRFRTIRDWVKIAP